MSTSKKSDKSLMGTKSRSRANKKKSPTFVSEEVGNYEKHPYFVKKANAAKERLLRVGLPDNLKVKAS
jgi:hypothetical protein